MRELQQRVCAICGQKYMTRVRTLTRVTCGFYCAREYSRKHTRSAIKKKVASGELIIKNPVIKGRPNADLVC